MLENYEKPQSLIINLEPNSILQPKSYLSNTIISNDFSQNKFDHIKHIIVADDQLINIQVIKNQMIDLGLNINKTSF